MNRRRNSPSDPSAESPVAASKPRRRAPRVVATAATETGDSESAPDTTPAHAAASHEPMIRVPIDVRWRDLDAFHHVNNSIFLTYIEEARLQWFQSLPGPWLGEDSAPVLAASQLNYRRPIEWPARLAVELSIERVGNTSLTLAHRIVAHDDASVLYSDGTAVLVWIDRSGRPSPLPTAVRDAGAR